MYLKGGFLPRGVHYLFVPVIWLAASSSQGQKKDNQNAFLFSNCNPFSEDQSTPTAVSTGPHPLTLLDV